MKLNLCSLTTTLLSLTLICSLKVELHFRGTERSTYFSVESEGGCTNLDKDQGPVDHFKVLTPNTKVEFYEGEDCVLRQLGSGTSTSSSLKAPIQAKAVNLVALKGSHLESTPNQVKIVRRGAFTNLLKSLFLPKRSNIEKSVDSNKLSGEAAYAKLLAYVNQNSKGTSKSSKPKPKVNLDKEESDA